MKKICSCFIIAILFTSFSNVVAQTAKERVELGIKLSKEAAYQQAFGHFVLAADSGNVEAMYHVAYAYEKGLGTDSVPMKAIYWYQRAADSGYKKAYLPLGVLYYYQKQIPEAEQYLLKAAKFDKASYGVIGYLYYEEEKYSNAYKWLNRAVKVGDADAMFYLGEMYLDGNGVAYSEERAVQYFVRAARKGNEQAKEMLDDLGYEYRTASERKSSKESSNEDTVDEEMDEADEAGLGDLDFDANSKAKQSSKKKKKQQKDKSKTDESIDEGDTIDASDEEESAAGEE